MIIISNTAPDTLTEKSVLFAMRGSITSPNPISILSKYWKYCLPLISWSGRHQRYLLQVQLENARQPLIRPDEIDLVREKKMTLLK